MKRLITLARHATVAMALVALTGCVTVWQPVKQVEFKSPSGLYSLDAPMGWMQFSFALPPSVYAVTRDGLSVQFIRVALQPIDKELPQATKKLQGKIDVNTPPNELADYALAELNADKNAGAVTVLERQPVKVAGLRGVRLKYTYRNKKGNTFIAERQMAMTPKGLLSVGYQAASPFHWDRDYPAYTTVLNSLQLQVAKS